MTEPRWIENALIIECAKCRDHPGAEYKDGSGVCRGCGGASWKVLATLPPATALDESHKET